MAKEKHQTLTPKQEAFALEYILNGRDATAAYQTVYDTKTESKNSLYVQAHRVLTNTKVSIRIHELEMAEFESVILTLEERKKILTKLGKGGDTKAIDLLNKMENIYTQKVEHSGELNLNSITDRLVGK